MMVNMAWSPRPSQQVIHRGQGESLEPPQTRGSVSVATPVLTPGSTALGVSA